jgi:hypothetical protein
MANVEHSALTGSNLHESKGVASAAVSTVYVADGAGSGSWTTVGNASLASAAKSFQAQLFHVQERSSNASMASGSWGNLALSTVVTNEISGASLAGSTITLAAGTYFIQAYSGAQSNNGTGGICQVRIFNNTDSVALLYGITAEAINGAGVLCEVGGRFTLSGTKDIKFQMRVSSTINTGVVNGFGGQELYKDVYIWKVA